MFGELSLLIALRAAVGAIPQTASARSPALCCSAPLHNLQTHQVYLSSMGRRPMDALGPLCDLQAEGVVLNKAPPFLLPESHFHKLQISAREWERKYQAVLNLKQSTYTG